jgi:carbamoylphosphate synthase small subunit
MFDKIQTCIFRLVLVIHGVKRNTLRKLQLAGCEVFQQLCPLIPHLASFSWASVLHVKWEAKLIFLSSG